MVILELQIDERVLREDKESNPASADAGTLTWTYFEMPVRFRIGDVELLEIGETKKKGVRTSDTSDNPAITKRPVAPSPWLTLPVLHVAVGGTAKVKEAWQAGGAEYTVPSGGYLRFERIGNDLDVMFTINQRRGTAKYQEILQAFEDFSLRVRSLLLQEVPELRDHPYWGTWFRGEG